MRVMDLDSEQEQVFAVTEGEVRAIESSKIENYLPLLSDDVVFLPPNLERKTGVPLRAWLRDFLNDVFTQNVEFAHGETVIRGDRACHEYTCSWTATRKTGGTPVSMSFKGLHVLRRQLCGQWKINRNIWNTDPKK